MTAFAAAWDNYLATVSLAGIARRACEADRAAFADEIRRFRRGLQLIRDDLAGNATGIGAAFIRANEAVALMNTDGGLDSPGPATATTWRLFQIVFVVANLAALAAREAPAGQQQAWTERSGRPADPPDDLDELDIADVLVVPDRRRQERRALRHHRRGPVLRPAPRQARRRDGHAAVPAAHAVGPATAAGAPAGGGLRTCPRRAR